MNKFIIYLLHYISKFELFIGSYFPRLILKIRSFFSYGVEPELNLLEILCFPKKASIDIGANAGMYSYHMSKYSKFVYIFEPNPNYFLRLTNLLKSNFKFYNIALSDKKGKSLLTVANGVNGAGSLNSNTIFRSVKNPIFFKKYPIFTETLDSFKFYNIGLIKIDVEGFELEVLKGSIETIINNNPIFIIEIEERHKKNSIILVNHLLNKYKYSSFFYENDYLVPFAFFDQNIHQNIKNINYKYINNFIFLNNDHLKNKKIKDFLFNA